MKGFLKIGPSDLVGLISLTDLVQNSDGEEGGKQGAEWITGEQPGSWRAKYNCKYSLQKVVFVNPIWEKNVGLWI